ncbi:MAG: glycosyltransferase family 4 protein [Candidatus Rokuibacteriota bacterium]
MRVLVLSSVFPNPKQPTFGVFIRERVRRVARHCEVVVAAPIPWFPLNGLVRGAQWVGIPKEERQGALRVLHPRFFCVPRYLKWLDALLYASSLLPYLARLRREFPFDVIDAHFAYPDGMAAALLGKAFACPVVITLRGSIVRLATYRLHRPQLRWALGAADRVISVSDSLKRVAVSLGMPPGRIRVIPNGVDPERFFPMDRAEARRGLGLPADRTILLSVGGINEGKGHDRVVALLPTLLRHRPDLLYVIVGGERPGDTARPVLDRTIERQGLQRHVLIAGERPYEEIARWMAAADLFCLATRSEGWANVLLEALACGRPVVSTRVGGNPEIVSSDALGILVSPADDEELGRAILEALDRAWDTDAMVRHARVHSWETAALAVVEEFRRLVPEGTSRTEAAPKASAHTIEERR